MLSLAKALGHSPDLDAVRGNTQRGLDVGWAGSGRCGVLYNRGKTNWGYAFNTPIWGSTDFIWEKSTYVKNAVIMKWERDSATSRIVLLQAYVVVRYYQYEPNHVALATYIHDPLSCLRTVMRCINILKSAYA